MDEPFQNLEVYLKFLFRKDHETFYKPQSYPLCIDDIGVLAIPISQAFHDRLSCACLESVWLLDVVHFQSDLSVSLCTGSKLVPRIPSVVELYL